MAAAGRAATALLYGRAVPFIFGVIYIDYTFHCEKMTVACVAAWHNAVKQIHAAINRFDYVAGRADAHEVARLVLGHKRLHRLDTAQRRK